MQRSLSPQALIAAVMAGLVLLAGCGSTKHAASSTATNNPTAPLPATSTTSSSSSQTTTTAPKPSTTPASTTKSTSNPTGGAGLPSGSSSGGSGSSSGGGGSSSGGGGGGGTNARVPATFTIAAGGRLSPPDVSAPAFLAVQLTVVSHDGAPHQVLLRTPTPHRLAVPAHGHASVLIPGLRAGRYPLEIDGAARGALSIGGEPGP